ERDLAHDVVPLAHEERMLAHAEHDVEVAGCAGVRPGLALAAQLESGAAVDAGRDLDVELVRPPLHAGALAAGARIRDDGALPAPRPTAPAAGPARAEEVSEQVADDVLEVAADVEARASRRALREGGVPEAVVEAPPLRIGEHLVGLRDLLEALLGLVAVLGI